MTQEEIMKLVTSKDGFIGHAMNIPHDRQNKTHELVLEYNQTSPADIKRGKDLLKQILGTYNEQVVIQHGVHFVVKTEDIHPPKTGISVHFCVLRLMAMQK